MVIVSAALAEEIRLGIHALGVLFARSAPAIPGKGALSIGLKAVLALVEQLPDDVGMPATSAPVPGDPNAPLSGAQTTAVDPATKAAADVALQLAEDAAAAEQKVIEALKQAAP